MFNLFRKERKMNILNKCYVSGLSFNVTVIVYLAGTKKKAFLYSDEGRTIKQNPFFDHCPGWIEFYASASNKYDIYIESKNQVMRNKIEEEEQKAVIEWKELTKQRLPALNNLFAIPNGGGRHAREAKNLRLSGVCAGYPDLALDYPAKGYHGLRIEMKTAKGKLTKEVRCYDKNGRFTHIREGQETWKKRLEDAGYMYKICRSSYEAIKTLKWYLAE